MQGNQFQRKYKQLNMLGKGNYGKVYRVKLNDGKEGKEAKYYVAKKMYLEGLSEEEIKGALGEIEILQKLNTEISSSEIPFVVTYKQFFRIDHELIIIMEFCQCGDLTTLLKNLKKNGQRLNEKIIAFWFIQLLFGVKALHSKNILHRDLKSANIFLTKNYSLKIGDFGISKVLEGSSAITCIGTPLYLSPQVCNNKPYGLSSDMWALGCILYEMCTLRYPFEGSNLIVLAKKIVMDEVEPLPSHYSKQMNDIVMKMFVKDNKKRITSDQLLKTPYIMKAIADFVKQQGKLEQLAIPIQVRGVQPSNISSHEQSFEGTGTMQTIKSVMAKTGGQTLQFSQSLTPKERMQLKKQQEARKRQEELTQAVKDTIAQKTFAKTQKQKILGQTGAFQQTDKRKMEIKIQNENKARSEIKYKAKEMQKMQTINLTALAYTLNNLSVHDNEEFEEVPYPELQGETKHIPIKQRPLPVKSTIKISQPSKIKEEEIEEHIGSDEEMEEYYDDDFQEYEEQFEKTKKQENILAYFENQLGTQTLSPTKRAKVSKAFTAVGASDIKSRIQTRVQECQRLVGHKRYQQLTKLFKEGKVNMQVDKGKYTENEKTTLYKIQEIVLIQMTN